MFTICDVGGVGKSKPLLNNYSTLLDHLKHKQNLHRAESIIPQPDGQFPFLGEIKTKRFSLGPQTYARLVVLRRASQFGFAMALPIVALIVCGLVYNIRLLCVAAMIVFILFPSLRFFGWYGILTSPWAISSIFPQEVSLSVDNEIAVDYYEMTEHEAQPPKDLFIPAHSISDCIFWGSNLIVSYDHHRELIIPLSAFADPSEAASFQRRLESTRHIKHDF